MDIEVDALQVHQAINSSDFYSPFGYIISNIKEAGSLFSDIRFLFVKRSVNRAAHAIAREAVFMSGPGEWHTIPPSFVASIISDDIMN